MLTDFVFGPLLSGVRLPSSLHGLFRLALGPAGMLDQLEMRLGIAPITVDETSRLLAYREALEALAATRNPFFRESLAVDPFGSSRVLLKWRDELMLAGWDSNPGGPGLGRIDDFAEVEAHFQQSGKADAGEAFRLRRILEHLEDGGMAGVGEVQLMGRADGFHQLWRSVLALLPVRPDCFPLPERPFARPGSTLFELQSSLIGTGKPGEGGVDESVRLVRGHVTASLANAAAFSCRDLPGSGRTALIGNRERLEPLNQAFASLDLPLAEAGARTSAGSILQLAPLLLRLHWKPADPRAWLEFLLHPISPVSRKMARNLAFTIQATPSRHSEDWDRAVAETLSSSREPEANRRWRQQAVDWLEPVEFEGEADSLVLSTTIRRLGEWSARRGALSEVEDSPWLRASASFRRLALLIESTPRMTRDDLEKIVSEWLPSAAMSDLSATQLGVPYQVTSPGHLLEPVDHVIWWLPEEARLPRSPWSREERRHFQSRGMIFPDEGVVRRQLREEAVRALLMAKESITFFTSSSPDSGAGTAPILVRIEAEFGDSIEVGPDDLIRTSPVSRVALPSQKQKWDLSSCRELFVPRKSESFSSLHQFIYNPWEWVLNYQAKIRPGAIADYRIIDDARSQGSLLHGFVESLLEPDPDPLELESRDAPDDSQVESGESVASGLLGTLVQRLFSGEAPERWESISKEGVQGWVEAQWNDILRAQAAHYLVAGNEASRSELLFLAKSGLWNLLSQLKAAKVIRVRCEEHLTDAPFCGGTLGGFVDLQVENEAGQIGVIDLKLGGKSGRIDELTRGRHLQLATYGRLVQAKYGSIAHCAYFIFSGGGILLARNQDFFPEATVATPKGAEDEWATCWVEFEQLWRSRQDALESGQLEVTLSGFDPKLPLPHWTIKEPGKYSQYRALAGWEPTS